MSFPFPSSTSPASTSATPAQSALPDPAPTTAARLVPLMPTIDGLTNAADCRLAFTMAKTDLQTLQRRLDQHEPLAVQHAHYPMLKRQHRMEQKLEELLNSTPFTTETLQLTSNLLFHQRFSAAARHELLSSEPHRTLVDMFTRWKALCDQQWAALAALPPGFPADQRRAYQGAFADLLCACDLAQNKAEWEGYLTAMDQNIAGMNGAATGQRQPVAPPPGQPQV